ncbi:MAG: NAD(P)-binding protein [Saprospiraceae bacterium]|nr:NAD(P)-binding protein [Saprospiraceae bacterium]MDZ4704820.1 NAD(P)-binding protein [Saprospiraceae bacterium]
MASQLQLPSKTDFLIVGAGISGLYAVWRLLRQTSKRKITILGRLNCTGGALIKP